jgi:hypothetical protein
MRIQAGVTRAPLQSASIEELDLEKSRENKIAWVQVRVNLGGFNKGGRLA